MLVNKMVEEVLPKPIRQLRIIYECYQAGVERFYFWLLAFLKEQLKYDTQKLTDEFTAGEASSYFGVIEARKGQEQEKVAQYTGAINGILKSLFQIIRELRIMDQRYGYYTKSKAGDESAEIALKSLWVDMVEGGGKNPSSVTSLAAQVGFVTLPDFFYSVHPKSIKDVDKEVEKVDTNPTLKKVLKRKLFQYMTWKENTEKEIKTRRGFMTKYLRQQFNIIKMYMRWVKPYLRNIVKLQAGDTAMSEDIITAAETAVIDLELFGVKWNTKKVMEKQKNGKLKAVKAKKRYHKCIQIKFHYRTAPQMMYQQEYQRGAIHVGRTELTFNAYVLTNEQIEAYTKERDKETIELLSSINASMEALKDDLIEYLEAAGEKDLEILGKKEEEKEKTIFDMIIMPLIEPIKALFGLAKKEKEEKEKPKKVKVTWEDRKDKAKLAKEVKEIDLWRIYDIFKKAYKMYTW